MKKAKMILDKDFKVGQVDDRLYGSLSSTWGGPSMEASMSRTILKRTRMVFAGMLSTL